MKNAFEKIIGIIVGVLCLIDLISVCLLIEGTIKHWPEIIRIYLGVIGLVLFIVILFWFVHFQKTMKKVVSAFENFLNGKTYKIDYSGGEGLLNLDINMFIDKMNSILNKDERLLLSHKEAEYLALQNQINPHFLYNTLDAIRGDALSEGLYSLAGTAEALSSFFRYTISGDNILSTVEDELINIRNYFQIQKYRFGESLKLDIVFIDDEEEIRKLRIPKLTLQPIVENCVFHGLEMKENKGTVKISFDQTESYLYISVKDDGVGMGSGTLKKLNASLTESSFHPDENSDMVEGNRNHTGIALKNVSQRIKLLFGNEYGITVYSSRNIGTNVKIVLPRQEVISASDNK